jgi:hypothetical protein
LGSMVRAVVGCKGVYYTNNEGNAIERKSVE